MFTRIKSPSQILLESELEHAIKSLRSHVPGSEDYARALEATIKLHGMMDKKSSSISKDTLANIGANLLGIAMILKHEWLNPINSKALNFVKRVQ